MKSETEKKIRKAMIDKDVTGAEIARRVGVCRSAIQKTITGDVKAHRLRKAIAKAIGIRLTDLWPDSKVNK